MSDGPLTLSETSDVSAALSSLRLVPPQAPVSLGTGATRALRDAMARFAAGDEHADRRAHVETAIDRIDVSTLAATAFERANAFIERCEDDNDGIEARRLGLRVPAEALAIALGVSSSELERVVADIERIVRSVGRGEPALAATDAATERLTMQFESHPDGPVVAISLLYQVFDSSAALLCSALLASTTDSPRRNALASTVRCAERDTSIGSNTIRTGETVRISLEGDGAEFGLGPHACPGSALALAIVSGIERSLEPFDVAADDIERFDDGRAAALPLIRR